MSEKSYEQQLFEARQMRLAGVGEQAVPVPGEWNGAIEGFLKAVRDGAKELFHVEYIHVEETYPDKVYVGVENAKGKLEYYGIGFEVTKNGLKFGSPIKMDKRTSWTKAEQLQQAAIHERKQMEKMLRLVGVGGDGQTSLKENRRGLPELKEVYHGKTVLLEDEQIEEGKVVKPMKIGGVATQGNVVNENDRYYRTKLWGRECERKQDAIKAGKMLGELDHPVDGKSKLGGTSVRYTKLEMDGDYMNFEGLVGDTVAGQNLKALLRLGVGVDISTRGFGNTKKETMDGKEVEVVQDDFELVAIDQVAGHSSLSAEIQYYQEGS